MIIISYLNYPRIDMKRTGRRLREECRRQHYSVKDIQNYLQIGAYQSVYAWFSGKAMPSLDNMFALSCLLGKAMEDLIVRQDEMEHAGREDWIFTYSIERILAYCRLLYENAA